MRPADSELRADLATPSRRAAWAAALLGLLAPLAAQQPPAAAERGPLPRGLAAIATRYAAKVAASARFVSGRSLASVWAEELAPDAPLQALIGPLLQLEVDEDHRTVTARLLGSEAVATYVPGVGCTLARGEQLAALRRGAAAALPPPPPDPRPWPMGDALPDLPLPDGVDPAALDAALDFAFTERDGRPRIRTRAVVVARGGRLLAERYAPGYDARSTLPGWSMTKSLVDALVGILVGDGLLDPQAAAPVPEWQQDPADPRRAIRLEDLLRMQSGLQWTEDYEAPDSHALRMLFGGEAVDFGGFAAVQPLAVEPGARWHYSSGTTNLLCRIVRRACRDDAAYRALLQRRLFARLGMASALIEPDPSGTFVGSSFGFATARDWARFGQLYLQHGVWDGERLLPEGWVQDSLTPAASALRARGQYGRQIWLNRGAGDDPEDRPFPRLPRELFYLSGHEGQYTVCIPGPDLVIVRLGCTKRGGFDLQDFVARVLAACGDA